ncbi:unnamed protein product [Allacma fusca]|uniref:Smr domain-containing protein n=1 Tax=Allacma fusca TaxID=39272 RepID=A0A8J2NJW3_9HEXA|nr:unnamed protein product [Allacma fusca]
MDKSDGYRKKGPHSSSPFAAFDSKRSQEEKVNVLQNNFPNLSSEVIEDILPSFDWDVDRAIEFLQDSYYDDDGTDVSPNCLDPEPPPPKETNFCGASDTFLEITKSQNVKPKSGLSPLPVRKTNELPSANLTYPAQPVDGSTGSRTFPALPHPAVLRRNHNSGSSSSRSTPLIGNENPHCSSTESDMIRDYNPVPGKITVYNALQDSAPWLHINQSSWNTDFNQQQQSNGHFYSEVPLFPDQREKEEHVLHDDDIYTRIDGEDWFSLQLEPQFVVDLFNSYSNPFGAIESERLLLNDLKIRIPPKLAFELFRHLCLNLLQKENSNGSSGGDSFDDDLEEDVPDAVRSATFGPMNTDQTLTPNLKKIMELEMRLEGEEARRVQNLRSQLQSTLATKLTVEHLRCAFPTLPLSIIEACFVQNNARYEETQENLKLLYPGTFIGEKMNISQDKTAFQEAVQSELQVLVENTRHQTKKITDVMNPTELRLEAQTHFFLMREYMQKRAECSYAPGIAEYYSEMSRLHAVSMREANRLAADLIFKKNNGPGKLNDQIDLHELSVQEAMTRLVPFLRERERSLRIAECLPIKIICGRGKHSDAHGPKIGPAVVNHLHKFGYDFRGTHHEGYIHVNLKKMSYKPRKLLNGK